MTDNPDTFPCTQPVAWKATFYQARRAFLAGARVISPSAPRGRMIVRPLDHPRRRSAEWTALTDQVRMWRNRYPRQTFYVIDQPAP